jgi:hypothetical protein
MAPVHQSDLIYQDRVVAVSRSAGCGDSTKKRTRCGAISPSFKTLEHLAKRFLSCPLSNPPRIDERCGFAGTKNAMQEHQKSRANGDMAIQRMD